MSDVGDLTDVLRAQIAALANTQQAKLVALRDELSEALTAIEANQQVGEEREGRA